MMSPMDLIKRITIDPAILAGKPIIRGTRISVELILEQLGQGWSVDDILDGYPLFATPRQRLFERSHQLKNS